MMRIRLLAALGVLMLGTLGAGCGDGESEAPPQSPHAVEARDFAFEQSELTVEPGTTVTWTNNGETTHTVKGMGFFSKALEPGNTYEHRFTEAGTYRYLCTLHPTMMRGAITVAPSGAK